MPNLNEASSFLDQWEALFELDFDASPFLSRTWTAEWLRVYQQALHPTLFRFPDATRIVPNAMALLVPTERRRGPFTIRRLALNTDGEAPRDSVVIENNRLLCRPDSRVESIAALAERVRMIGVDELVVSGTDSFTLEALLAAFPDWTSEVDRRDSHFVDLARVRALGGDPLVYLSANARAQVKRSIRKYEAIAPLVCEVAPTATVAETWLDELIALHDTRWRAVGKEGSFASRKRRAFHFAFLRSAVPRNEAYVMRIRTGMQTVGVLYGILSHGLVNFYQSGFHATDDPHLKPGLVSHCLAIRHFAAAGYREYDFLASAPGESRYKQSLATHQRDLFWVTLSRPSYKYDILQFVRRVRRAYRSRLTLVGGARTDK